MDGAALPPPHQVGRWQYLVLSLLFGGPGSMVALAAFGQGTYRVGPLVVQMKVRPATSGTTELAVQPAITQIQTGHVEAKTHEGFLAGKATVVGVVGDVKQVLPLVRSPRSLVDAIKEDGETAMRSFGIKVGLVTLGGGAAGGLAIALLGMKLRRVFQGALAGLVLVGGLGIVAWQTYDEEQLTRATFRPPGAVERILER